MSPVTSSRREEAAQGEVLKPAVRLRSIAKTFGAAKAVELC